MTQIAILSIGVTLFGIWISLAQLKPRVSVSVALCLFIASMFFGVWLAYDRELSWSDLLYLLSNIGLFLIIAYSPLPARWILIGVVVLCGLISLYFITQYAYFHYEDEVVGLPGKWGRLTGSVFPSIVFFSPHPNTIAAVLGGAILLMLGLSFEGGRARWGYALLIAIAVYGLVITGSRGAWTGVTVALAVGAFMLLPKDVRLPIGIGLGSLAGTLLLFYLIFKLTNPITNPGGIESRISLYRNVLYLLSDYAFTGIGLGNTFGEIYSRYALLIEPFVIRHPHNIFFAVWLGQGLLGIIALIWLLIEYYRFIIRVEGIDLPHRSKSLFRGAWLGSTAILIHSLVDEAWTVPISFILLGLAVAFGRSLLARNNPIQVNRSAAQSVRFNAKYSFAFLAIVLVGGIFFVRRPLIGLWYANMGAIQQTSAALSPEYDNTAREEVLTRAEHNFEQALIIDPTQPTANRRMAMIALDQHDFETALALLSSAYPYEANNQALLKLLGYASLWTGQPDLAENSFSQIERREELIGELNHYWWWWGTQQRNDLANYANEMRQRLLLLVAEDHVSSTSP
jgi:hypothetical protein